MAPMDSEAAAPRPRLVVTNHEPAFLELLQLLLTDEGYDVLVPPKLDEPYPFIRAQRPAAVVLDLPFRQETMTLAMLDTLRLDPATAAVPVGGLHHLAGGAGAGSGGARSARRRRAARWRPRPTPARRRPRTAGARRRRPARRRRVAPRCGRCSPSWR